MYPPPRKWGRGTTLRSRVVEGARAATKLFRRKRRVEFDAPSTTLPPTRSALRRTQTLRSSQSERRRVAGADKRSRSRDAVSVRTRVMRQATANNFAAIPIFVRSPRRWIGRMHHDRARRTKERTEIKKEAERRKAQDQPPHLQVRRASSGTRTPSGVPLRLSPRGLFIPKAQHRPCFLRLGRSVRSCTAAPTGGRRPCASPRALPAPRLSQSSEAPRAPVLVPAG